MKYASVLLVALVLGGCTHDQETAAVFGLLVGAAILSASVDDDDHREHRHEFRRGHRERWRDDDGRGRSGHREYRGHQR